MLVADEIPRVGEELGCVTAAVHALPRTPPADGLTLDLALTSADLNMTTIVNALAVVVNSATGSITVDLLDLDLELEVGLAIEAPETSGRRFALPGVGVALICESQSPPVQLPAR